MSTMGSGIWLPGRKAELYGRSMSMEFLSNSQTQGTGASINASGNDVWVGAGPSAYFDGDIDDVRIYNCALSATEVQHLYLMGQ